MIRSVTLTPANQDDATRAGDFNLLPDNPSIPIILSQPQKNVSQTTWIENVDPNTGNIRYRKLQSVFGVFTVVPGTSVEWLLVAADPSNVNDPFSDANLRYTWKKDGAVIYEINSLKNGKGIAGIAIQSQSCVPEITGRYVCEVSNEYGSVESDPVDLVVLDTDNESMLYRNILKNGNARGGLADWVADEGGVVSRMFKSDLVSSKNFGSLDNNMIYWDEREGKNQPTEEPMIFHFDNGASWSTFGSVYRSLVNRHTEMNDNTLYDLSVPGKYETYLPGWMSWAVPFPSCIVPNEDFIDTAEYAAFFPGMNWMDKYNRNDFSNLIGLYKEAKDQSMYYFTRDKITFVKDGGSPEIAMNQTIDLTKLQGIINGNVLGIDYLAANFFAYVGIGISRYRIKLNTVDGGVQTFNWYIEDTENIYKAIRNGAIFKKKVRYGTPIEIEPVTDDIVEIDLLFYGANDQLKKKVTIPGPTARDIFAVKEKVYLPISLYPIIEFVEPNSNPITIYGKTFTNTDALLPLFRGNLANQMNTPQGSLPTDRNAAFLIKKFKFYYGPAGYYDVGGKTKKSLLDAGAAAMIGVGTTEPIPRDTQKVVVRVRYIHTSDVILQSSELGPKGWDKSEIYHDLPGSNSQTSRRVVPYGNPRSGVTSMKMTLLPEGQKVIGKHVTYFMPPLEKTVLGLQRELLSTDSFDSSQPGQFQYTILTPNLNPEDLITSIDPSIVNKATQEYANERKAANQKRQNDTVDDVAAAGFGTDVSGELEESSESNRSEGSSDVLDYGPDDTAAIQNEAASTIEEESAQTNVTGSTQPTNTTNSTVTNTPGGLGGGLGGGG